MGDPTASFSLDLRAITNAGNLNNIGSVFRQAKVGNRLSTVKAVITGLTGATAIDITAAATAAAATITGYTLNVDDPTLPAIGSVVSLRTTAGSSQVGNRIVTDAGGTAAAPGSATLVGVALLSDDGKTLTFDANVTAFVITYQPRAAVPFNTVQSFAAP